jgi:uncharacterized damage-inducible protein DinB
MYAILCCITTPAPRLFSAKGKMNMNASDILMYGDRTLMSALEGVPQSEWETGGVCGVWSVKDILAHMTVYEHLTAEVLSRFVEGEDESPTPYISRMMESGASFNDDTVPEFKTKPGDEVLAEYHEAHRRVMSLIGQISAETLRQAGTMPSYGEQYSLDDYLVYTQYGHKREHSAQINVFRDKLEREDV